MSQPDSDAQSINETEITLGLLAAVEENSDLTQRSIATELGIALGLANTYLKRCAKKGFIKISQAPRNRYLYYITPRGCAEKSRLTAEYLSQSLKFFRAARMQCSEMMDLCQEKNWRKVALAGGGELAEISILCAQMSNMTLVGMAHDGVDGGSVLDLPMLSDEEVAELDAVIVTNFRQPQHTFDRLIKIMPGNRVLTLSLLKITRPRSDVAETGGV